MVMEHCLVIQSCLLKKQCSTLNIAIYELIKNPLTDEDNQEWSVSIEILLLSHYILALLYNAIKMQDVFIDIQSYFYHVTRVGI